MASTTPSHHIFHLFMLLGNNTFKIFNYAFQFADQFLSHFLHSIYKVKNITIPKGIVWRTGVPPSTGLTADYTNVS